MSTISKTCRITASGSSTVAAAKLMLSGIGITLRSGHQAHTRETSRATAADPMKMELMQLL